MGNLIEIKNLKTYFYTEEGCLPAVDGVTFSIQHGETLALVGESGCGKSVTSLSIMRLIPIPPGRYVDGQILFGAEDLLKKSEREMQKIRGNDIAMIFQEPMTSLNPVFPIGDQISEAIILHQGLQKVAAMQKTLNMLELVGIPDPDKRVKEYPHQLSGGIRQRVMIAMALCCNPKLLIADEPTTALDVTIQAQILALLKRVKYEFGMSMLLVTHDLGVVAETADRVAVMYAGKIVEICDVKGVFQKPLHPYTEALLNCIPRIGKRNQKLTPIEGSVPALSELPAGCRFHSRCIYARNICMTEEPKLLRHDDEHFVACHFSPQQRVLQVRTSSKVPEDAINVINRGNVIRKEDDGILVQLKEVKKHFFLKRGLSKTKAVNKAVDGVSLSVKKRETFAIVGESGCGKSTLGRTILQLIPATDGDIIFEGYNLKTLSPNQLRKLRKEMQIVFQDPYASLNPRMPIGDIIIEPLIVHRIGDPSSRRKRVQELLELVGLPSSSSKKFAHEFSGGQRQRIGIARAIATNPKLIICDEPVSALDVSIQSQILNLLEELQKVLGLTYIFISHNLSVVDHISDRVAVMYLGKVVEMGETKEVFDKSLHPYTQALLSAIPIPDPDFKAKKIILEGDVPSPVNPPSGCRFRTRCWLSQERCEEGMPNLREISKGHFVACHLIEEYKPTPKICR